MQFNGINIDFVIAKKGREFLPSINNITINPPTKVGSHFIRDKIGMRVIPVDVTVLADSRLEFNQKVRELAQILYTDEPKILKFDDDDIIYYAKLSGSTPINEQVDYGTFTINFECYDPYKYDLTESIINFNTNTIIFNQGISTPCKLELIAESNLNNIEIFINNQSVLKLVKNFNIGDKIIIDTDKRIITINGQDGRKYMTLYSDYFLLPTGQFEASVNTTKNKLTFLERWL